MLRNIALIFMFGVSVFNFEIDSLGNIIGFDFPEYNIITEDDDLNVASWKQQSQFEMIR